VSAEGGEKPREAAMSGRGIKLAHFRGSARWLRRKTIADDEKRKEEERYFRREGPDETKRSPRTRTPESEEITELSSQNHPAEKKKSGPHLLAGKGRGGNFQGREGRPTITSRTQKRGEIFYHEACFRLYPPEKPSFMISGGGLLTMREDERGEKGDWLFR